MAGDTAISGAADPYSRLSYSPGSTEKNTLTVDSFIRLLAAQLQNQDMTNPMDNSEMMAQMTQMAMVQSMGAMTESISTSTAISTQTYAAGLVGQRVTVAVTEEGSAGNLVPTGVKYGTVVSVDLTGGIPVLKLEGDAEEYPLSFVLGMGEIDNPYVEEEEEGGEEGGDETPEAEPETSRLFAKF